MRRGDIVTVAVQGDFGKPRPAVIVQTDALPPEHVSVVVCPLTSTLADAPYVRVTILPDPTNGMRLRSQIMADKPVTIRRARVGPVIGHLGQADMSRLNAALAFIMGLAG
jgi:mRNA interferase MazF